MKKSFILLSSIVLVSGQVNCELPKQTALCGEAVQALKTVLNLPFVDKNAVGKELFIGLTASKNALNSVEAYNKKYPDDDKRFTPEQKKLLNTRITTAIKKSLLASVSDVLPILYKYKIVIRKLVVESLGEKETLFHKFFDSTPEESKTFFNDKLNTKEDLYTCCLDFQKVFGDLKVTIPDVFELGQREMEKIEKAAAKK